MLDLEHNPAMPYARSDYMYFVFAVTFFTTLLQRLNLAAALGLALTSAPLPACFTPHSFSKNCNPMATRHGHFSEVAAHPGQTNGHHPMANGGTISK